MTAALLLWTLWNLQAQDHNPLSTATRGLIRDKETWLKRREEIGVKFEQEVYGVTPKRIVRVRYEVLSAERGAATKRVLVHFGQNSGQKMDLTLYLPEKRRPAPVI